MKLTCSPLSAAQTLIRVLGEENAKKLEDLSQALKADKKSTESLDLPVNSLFFLLFSANPPTSLCLDE